MQFSERFGMKTTRTVMQFESMDSDLRNSIWNALDYVVWSRKGFIFNEYGGIGQIDKYSNFLW